MKVLVLITLGCSLLFGNFVKENGLVKDTQSGLLWQDDGHVESTEMIYSEAKGYCKNLVINSFDDWRLPNVDELESIVDRSRYKPALQRGFYFGSSENYWSATLFAGDEDRAWDINFKSGVVEHNRHSYDYFVRCVRGGK